MLFAATGLGLFISTDGGVSFALYDYDATIQAEFVLGVVVGPDRKLYVAALNDGLYITTLEASSTLPVTAATANDTYKVSLVPSGNVCPAPAQATGSVKVEPPAAPLAGAGGAVLKGESFTPTASGCQGPGYAVKWYNALNNAEVALPVSPVVTTNYVARCSLEQGSTTCLSNPSANVTVRYRGEANLSVKSGNWNDATTWQLNRVPATTDIAIIVDNHEVLLNTTGAVREVEFRGNGKLIYSTAVSLQLGQ